MSEEAILFGKKRHLFGGIEPSNMIRFRSPIKNGVVYIDAIPPKDTVIDGQTLCTVAGVVIRRKTDGYPKDEFDGELVCDISYSDMLQSKIYDEDADISVINYYTAFPYSTQGVYNRNPLNRCSTTKGEAYLYGFDIDTSDPEPSTRVSYPDDVDNTHFNSAYMNYETSIFNYGDWDIAPGVDFMPKPCVLSTKGEVLYYLNPNDYTKKEDGTNAVIDGTDGMVMMEWPKIYTYRELTDDGVYKFRCSNIKLDENWECWSNYNHSDVQVPHFYTAVYSGHVGNATSTVNTPTSACNSATTNSQKIYTAAYNNSVRTSSFIDTIGKMGEGWNTEILADRLLIQDLLIMMGKNTNAQTIFGLGSKYGSTNIAVTGTMNNKGLFWGSNDNDDGATGSKYGVKIFGMEHWWGNVSRFMSGWIYDSSNSIQRVKITYSKRDGSTAEGYTNNHSDYIPVGNLKSGYISTMKVFPFGRIPVTCSGSSSTYECDKVAIGSSSYVYFSSVGGEINDNLGAGPFASSFTIHSTYSFGNGHMTMPLSYR